MTRDTVKIQYLPTIIKKGRVEEEGFSTRVAINESDCFRFWPLQDHCALHIYLFYDYVTSAYSYIVKKRNDG